MTVHTYYPSYSLATQTNQCQFRLMSVYQPRSSLVTLSFRPTQHLKTRDGYTALRETSRQQRGVACAQCIPYLVIDKGENDWQREPEVSEPPSALRACLVTKMAETLHDSATKQVSDILELAITDWRVLDHIFGKRERQTQELQQFKGTVHANFV